jgi:hypothetical protein
MGTTPRRTSPWEEFDAVLHDPETTPVDVLRAVGTYLRYLSAIEEEAVRAARRTGATWEDIGEAIGVTRQAAWQRLRHLEEAVHADAEERERFLTRVLATFYSIPPCR